jgi:hypothetical protein
METIPYSTTLEDLKLPPAKEPMRLVFSGDFDYEGYSKSYRSFCHLDVYSDGKDKRVFIATELSRNTGTSVTNAIEMVAEAVEKHFGLPHVFGPDSPKTNILVEHYDQDDHYSIVEFEKEGGSLRYYVSPGWWGVDKSEVERLTGGPIA